jgi:phosphate transport system protein
MTTQHIVHSYDQELQHLTNLVLTMGGMVESQIAAATAAISARDSEASRKIVADDQQIDDLEAQVERLVLKLLALRQPMAVDLRGIMAALKMSGDLERMGDLAANIAERALTLAGLPTYPFPEDFDRLVELVRGMVENCLTALVNRDSKLARSVCSADDQVDAINRKTYEGMQEVIRKDPSVVDRAINTISVSRHLERIADIATNIAEDVVFMVEGEIIRHNL